MSRGSLGKQTRYHNRPFESLADANLYWSQMAWSTGKSANGNTLRQHYDKAIRARAAQILADMQESIGVGA